MHHSRIAALLLGAWLAGTVMMLFFGAESFSLENDIHASIPAAASKAVPPATLRAIVHHVIGEENRSLFQSWELVQIPLGIVLTLVLFLGVRSRLMAALAFATLAIGFAAHIIITPDLTWLSRSMEAVPGVVDPRQRKQFWSLHTMYITLVVSQIVIGGVVAALLVRMRRRSQRKDDVDVSRNPARASLR